MTNTETNTDSGRAMGVDFGEARIGIALSDPTRTLATPLLTLHEKNKGEQTRKVAALVAEHGVTSVVVGLPLKLDGEHGDIAITTEKFAKKLRTQVEAEVVFWDERFTSIAADMALAEAREHGGRRRGKKRTLREEKGDRDMAAAAILLQEWLDAGGGRGSS